MKKVKEILAVSCLYSSLAVLGAFLVQSGSGLPVPGGVDQTGSDKALVSSVTPYRIPRTSTQVSAYDNVAVSRVTGYVNVRQEPNTSSAVVGKVYNNCAATILETVSGEGGNWYRIQSGSVSGYIKAQYFVTGETAAQLARSIGKEFAMINTDSLRLREKASLSSNTLTMLSKGARYVVIGEEGDFYKVAIDSDMEGYLAKQYCKVTVEFEQAVSLAEEQAKARETAQRKQDADAAIARLEEVKLVEAKKDPVPESGGISAPVQGTIAANPNRENDKKVEAPAAPASSGAGSSTNTTGPNAGSTAVASATRTAIVAYAKQFLGNPYVYGGVSLTNGADCSGFTQSIFSHFGITIGRSSRDQAVKGKAISVDSVQPGDLLFYASGDYINHVAIYIGGNQVIHSSNERTGIIISPYNYRTPCKAVTFLD